MFEKEFSSQQLQEERLATCDTCEHYIKATTTCKMCLCFMKVKVTLTRAKCPLNKWKE